MSSGEASFFFFWVDGGSGGLFVNSLFRAAFASRDSLRLVLDCLSLTAEIAVLGSCLGEKGLCCFLRLHLFCCHYSHKVPRSFFVSFYFILLPPKTF